MKKILIDENKERANREIQAFKNKAGQMTAAIASYNAQEALTDLTPETAPLFLKRPKPYLDERIIAESGITAKNAKPDKVADLLGIDYGAILRHITRWNVMDYVVNENLRVEVSAQKIEEITEGAKFYLSDEAQIKQYREIQKLTALLNEYCEKLGFDNFDINTLGRQLKLNTEKPKGQSRYRFEPNVHILKKMLSD